jgi:hypothetical protein
MNLKTWIYINSKLGYFQRNDSLFIFDYNKNQKYIGGFLIKNSRKDYLIKKQI